MDISNLKQNLAKGLEQKTNTELAALSRVLDIALGKTTTATVTETIPVTAQERQQLLNKTTDALAQLIKQANSSPLNPAAKEELSRLLEQQAIIKSPDLKWVNLLVNDRQLLTYTDKNLTAGQTVPVQLTPSQKLVLLELPAEGDDAATPSPKTLNSAQELQNAKASTYSAKTISSELAKIIAGEAKIKDAGSTEQIADDDIVIKNSTATTAAPHTKIQIATVTETAPITPNERKELLKKTTEELTQLNKMANSSSQPIPGLKAAIDSLLQQQAVIKSPDAKWLHLTLNNQPLLTYTDKPLVIGQTVAVQIVTPQKIVVMDFPQVSNSDNPEIRIKLLAETISSAINYQKLQPPTYFARLAPATEDAKTNSPAETTALKTDNTTKTTITLTSAAPTIKTQMATVTETAPINNSERQELIKKTTEELVQLNKMASSSSQVIPGLKEAISSLLQQQALIKSPDAKWIHLTVNDKTLLTYSDKPLASGQTISVQMITAQKLIIVDQPSPSASASANTSTTTLKSSTENSTSVAIAAKNSAPTYFATLSTQATPIKTQAEPVNLQNITQTSAKNSLVLPNAMPDALKTKSTLSLNMATSSVQMATAVKTTPVTVQQRQELLSKISDELIQISKLSSSAAITIPSVKEAISALLEQQAAIKSPELKLLQLSANNQTVNVFTNKAITAGQTIPIQLITEQKVALVKPTEITTHEKPRAAPVNNKDPKAASALEKLFTQTNNQEDVEKTSIQAVPTADNEKIISSPNVKGFVPTTVEQALKSVAEKIRAQLALNQTSVRSPTPSTKDVEVIVKELISKPALDPANKAAKAQLLQSTQANPETLKKMDITNLTQYVAKALEQKNSTELAALSRTLNIALGKVVMANVTETAPVTAQERQALLTKTADALTQLTKLAANPALLPPAAKAAISQLLEQQALLKSPDLKWANLVVNDRSVLTYTDKPLSAGQSVPVQLLQSQKLVLLDLPAVGANTAKNAAANVNLSTAALNPNANPVVPGKLAQAGSAIQPNASLNMNVNKNVADAALATKTMTPPINTPANNKLTNERGSYRIDPPEIKQVVGDKLRNLLPYKDLPNVLFSAVNQWQKIPAASQQRLVPPTVEQALKSVAEQIRSPLQIIQPKVLANIIKNSGVFFENALSNNATPKTAIAPTNTNAAEKLAMALGNTNAAPSDVNAKTTSVNTTGSNASNTAGLNQTYSQDLKGSLLTLLSKINHELTGSTKPLTEEQTVRLLQQLSAQTSAPAVPPNYSNSAGYVKNSFNQDIGMLVHQLMTKPVKELSNKELRTQLLVLLQQHSVHSLAKIQLQQLASLNSDRDTKETSQPVTSWQIEIPLKHLNEVQQLQLRIDQEWIEEKNDSEESKAPTKVKQWSVTLRFDLPTLGEFCAQLAIVDTTVSATLWAAEEKTFGEVRKQMDDLRKNLEKEGVEVKQLKCMKGMPPDKPMTLSYSLIDIST